MRNLKLTVGYDGTRYFGWQKNAEGLSIEGELERVLAQIAQHEIVLQAASRTDAGVHATGQVVNCFWEKTYFDPAQLLLSLNQLLPDDITVWRLEEEAEDFHPTLHAIGKEYRYRISTTPFVNPLNRLYAWHVYQTLDRKAMDLGAELLVGEKDFSAFSNQNEEDGIRRLDVVEWVEEGEELVLILRGNRFLYRMARNIAGTLIQIGQGKISPDRIPQIIDSKDRKQAGITAPAHGLTLYQVLFPNK